MATSEIKLKPKMGWEVKTLATGFKLYINRDAKIACAMLSSYSVVGASAGNMGSLAGAGVSVFEETQCPVFVIGQGGGLMRISANGELSLLNQSLAAYISGSVTGCAFFPIN